MQIELLISLFIFASITSVTPGPNNFMVMSSGVNFGVKKSIPLLSGIAFGFTAMVLIIGILIEFIIPVMQKSEYVLKILGAVYIFWMSWQIAKSGRFHIDDSQKKSVGFSQAALLQWLNPKAWMMAVTANSAYGQHEIGVLSAVVVATVFALVSFPSNAVWLFLGSSIRKFSTNVKLLSYINITLGILLAVSTLPLLFSQRP